MLGIIAERGGGATQEDNGTMGPWDYGTSVRSGRMIGTMNPINEMPLSPLACRAVASSRRRVPHGAREKITFCFTKSMAPSPHDDLSGRSVCAKAEGMGRGYGERGIPPNVHGEWPRSLSNEICERKWKKSRI